VIEVGLDKPSLVWRLNPLHFINPATAGEACLIGMIDTYSEATTKFKTIKNLEWLSSRVESSEEVLLEEKIAVRLVMDKIRLSDMHRETARYEKFGFEDFLIGTQ
jgi:hypothetical protein